MSLTASQAIRQARSRFQSVGIGTPALDAELLLAEALKVRREQILLDPDRELKDVERTAFDDLALRREQFEPVARIIGSKEFWSLDFQLNEDALVPRPDSETLVEAALVEARTIVEERPGRRNLRVLDLGTGSGCLLISLLHELPEAYGVGIDLSEKAINCAVANARRHRLDGRALFLANNWLDGLDLSNLGGAFDIAVCNPPYIPSADIAGLGKEVSLFDPRRALDGGAEGLDCYRIIAAGASRFLTSDGRVIIELGDGQAETVEKIFADEGFEIIGVWDDLAGRPRALVTTPRPSSLG